eukprot:CAMPEP_0173392572 /NCGR_PEP_ID=MMETSP1356-20130122/20165_1 /TAXON_ID=77927 ORGANISM="Hemiselmis virescens, Strain PCC157" /NCGR_SAMPLE_ID=MMETSP1356 /ASSEMBLY_ACC=CAM_ASM_000847 /LENGTH=59 /DNA_ID=CAMNT_0014350399 /DNA_START=31 /DNA_END=210 /DNA_ORIENTATION=-
MYNKDSRAPRTMLWSDGMSAAQARKSLFGNTKFAATSDGFGGKPAISKYAKLANPGMYH